MYPPSRAHDAYSPGSYISQTGWNSATVFWSFSSLVSSGVDRFASFLGGPSGVGALRLLDPLNPEVNCDDDMVGSKPRERSYRRTYRDRMKDRMKRVAWLHFRCDGHFSPPFALFISLPVPSALFICLACPSPFLFEVLMPDHGHRLQ